jgi:DNA-binding beta-propeller fold protein YncE
MSVTRRTFLETSAALAATSGAAPAFAQAAAPAAHEEDRVLICNEDSNTLSVIDPRTNAVETPST